MLRGIVQSRLKVPVLEVTINQLINYSLHVQVIHKSKIMLGNFILSSLKLGSTTCNRI